ncbi:hypothetical protein ACFQ1S_11840, partial [Kibdelosporangium lantanae]
MVPPRRVAVPGRHGHALHEAADQLTGEGEPMTHSKLANVLYHDWEAGSYDEKWSISYDERCIEYATGRF